MKKIKCITLYPEVYSNKNLTPNEKIYLSVIRYYTIEGRTHCCKFNDKEMGEELEMDIKFIRKMKCNLKKLGLITVTDNGIIYNKITPSKEETSLPVSNKPLPDSNNSLPNSNKSLPDSNQPLPNSNEKFYKYIEKQSVARVNKENKEENKKNKDNKPEVKFDSNFEFIFSKVKDELRTEENKSYLLNKFKEKIDDINSISRSELSVSNLISQFEYIIRKITYDEWEKERVENKKKYIEELKRVSGLFE